MRTDPYPPATGDPMNTTLEIAGAKLSVPTTALFRAWMREHVDPTLAAPAAVLRPPMLDDGEIYLGAFASGDGGISHHTVLLPFDRDDAPWREQMDWAKGEGFDLPNRLELLMMLKTMRGNFQKAAYWSCDVHHEDSAYAWCQYFGDGNQLNTRKGAALRAVAVRRSPIQPFTHS